MDPVQVGVVFDSLLETFTSAPILSLRMPQSSPNAKHIANRLNFSLTGQLPRTSNLMLSSCYRKWKFPLPVLGSPIWDIKHLHLMTLHPVTVQMAAALFPIISTSRSFRWSSSCLEYVTGHRHRSPPPEKVTQLSYLLLTASPSPPKLPTVEETAEVLFHHVPTSQEHGLTEPT